MVTCRQIGRLTAPLATASPTAHIPKSVLTRTLWLQYRAGREDGGGGLASRAEGRGLALGVDEHIVEKLIRNEKYCALPCCAVLCCTESLSTVCGDWPGTHVEISRVRHGNSNKATAALPRILCDF